MAVFRVQKTKNFVVMSNRHLREKDMSLKAKGLLSLMLSLPDDWDYSLKGLSKLSKDNIDGVRTAVRELEQFGYLKVNRLRDSKGVFKGIEYLVFETPRLEYPNMDIPKLEIPSQLSTKKDLNIYVTKGKPKFNDFQKRDEKIDFSKFVSN